MLSGAQHCRGIESPMDVDRKGPSIFDTLLAAGSSAASSASESSASESSLSAAAAAAASTCTSTSTSAPKSIFGTAAASAFKFEMPKASPSPTLRAASATIAGSGDSFGSLRFSTALSQSLPRDSGIAPSQHQLQDESNQGNGTDPSPCHTPTPRSPPLRSPLDDSFDLADQNASTTPASPNTPMKLNLDLSMDLDDDQDSGPSIFDGTPLARPLRAARRLSKGFARRFTPSSAAAAAEASAQLDADELAPATPTRGKRIPTTRPPLPRSSARTITQRNVFTHHDSDSDHHPPSPPSPSAASSSTTSHRRHPSIPGTNANHVHMPPPSSVHRPTTINPARSTPHQTPHRTPGHTPRTGNLNPTLTPRGTPRHKRPRRDYDSDHATDHHGSGDDNDIDMYDVGDNSIMYMGERFHGHNHQYMPPPPPMQHTPYGFANQPHMWVQQPFYPYATPQGMHVHPQVIYGPPPAPPQLLLHAAQGQGQGPQFRRPPHVPHMMHSDDEYADDDGLGDHVGDTSVTHHHTHSQSQSRTARGGPAPQPTHVMVRSYTQSYTAILATAVMTGAVFLGMYMGYAEYMAKRAGLVTAMQVDMHACARKFQENQCGATTGRPPMLADACLELEKCMARDPYKEIVFGTVAAAIFAGVTDTAVTSMSTKTLVFIVVVIVALVLAARLSLCCVGRRDKGKERGRSNSRSRGQRAEDVSDDGGDQGAYQGGGGGGARRRQQEHAPGDFMGGAPIAIMPPPSSTARQQQRGYAPQHPQHPQQPSPFATPVYQGGYYQDVRPTPGSSGRMGTGMGMGMGMGSGYGQQRQQQETPSRMPGAGSMRRRRQM